MKRVIGLVAALAISLPVFAQSARDNINIVGSSTVFPFSTVVAEQFGRSTSHKTPKVESTGSGGGLKLFCAGIGVQHPDITNASRAIKKSEIERCAGNGVTDIVEVKIGYDGIVIANASSAPQYNLTLQQVFLALAKMVPNPDGTETIVANPYTHWNQIDAKLPATEIRVMGPPPTSGTRDAFVEIAMEGGAKKFAWLADMRKSDKKAFKALAHTLREDGHYVEAGENDNLIVQKLNANTDSLGIFGFSFLDNNTDKVKGATIDDVEPAFENIADGSYPVSRALFMYAKGQHVRTVPGMHEFLKFFASETVWGPDGRLADKGLIPMPDAERAEMARRVRELHSM